MLTALSESSSFALDLVTSNRVVAVAALVQMITVIFLVRTTRAAVDQTAAVIEQTTILHEQTEIMKNESQFAHFSYLSPKVMPIPEIARAVGRAQLAIIQSIENDSSSDEVEKRAEREVVSRIFRSDYGQAILDGRVRAVVLLQVAHGGPALRIAGLMYDGWSGRYLRTPFVQEYLSLTERGYLVFGYEDPKSSTDTFDQAIIENFGEAARFALKYFRPHDSSMHFLALIYQTIDGRVWLYRHEFDVSIKLNIRSNFDATPPVVYSNIEISVEKMAHEVFWK
jgi:hypothetical protein